MTVNNEAVIKKRYTLVSIMLPVICVLMLFLGFWIRNFDSIYSIIGPLAFGACFGFIFSFFIDMRKNTVLNSIYKIILLLLGTGLCFFVPLVMDSFGTALVVILVVSLFCAFLSFEASLIILVGICIMLWSFLSETPDTGMIIYISSCFMVCVIIAFADSIPKLVYSALAFTVFYAILNIIFENDGGNILGMTSFTVWLCCIAVLICLFFIKSILTEEATEEAEKATEEAEKAAADSAEGKAAKAAADKFAKKAAEKVVSAIKPLPPPVSISDREWSAKELGLLNPDEAEETAASDNGLQGKAAQAGKESEDLNNAGKSQNDIPVNSRNLYESIAELSGRLMKLESENSVLQLMLNSSVYDLSTITDPDYPYIVKLKNESPKNYQHCIKVAKISSEAAELIGGDSEEAYAIGMYLKAVKFLGEGALSVLAGTYKIPKHIITAVDTLSNKVSSRIMTRETGIVMLTDDIINMVNYIRAKQKNDISMEMIINNTFKVRKDQNYIKSAGFSNEELQLLRLFYNDVAAKEHL